MIDVTPELHRRIRVAAAQRDLSMREYVEGLLETAVPAEAQPAEPHGRPLARETLERLRRARERISGGQTFPDPAEIIRQMRDQQSKDLVSR